MAKKQEDLLPSGNEDGFFTPIQNNRPFLKIAAQGFAGSGKSYTLAQIAIGLHKRIGSTKPVVVFDTEESSKFLLPIFQRAGIEAVSRRSRSLSDLRKTFDRVAEGYSDILIIDSISHVWENFLEAFKKQKGRTRLEFQDWGIIKPTWKQEFSDPYVRGPFHCLFTGRAGYEYATEVDEETHKRTIYKSGVKMKVDGETAYEPDILLHMDRFEDLLDDDPKKKQVYRTATVLKSRSASLDGKVIQNPTYEHFAAEFDFILNGSRTDLKQSPEGNDAELIKKEDDKREYIRQRDIELEKIKACFEIAGLGTSAGDKAVKAAMAKRVLGTTSWTEVEKFPPDKLRPAREELERMIERMKAVEPEERMTFVESYELAENKA